jgi:hypothetical protein
METANYPFKQEPEESLLEWLMCCAYINTPVRVRNKVQVFLAFSHDIDAGNLISVKYQWEDRAEQWDKYQVMIGTDGKLDDLKVLKSITSATANLLHKQVGMYHRYVTENQNVLSNNLDLQGQSLQVLRQISGINKETTETLFAQEDIKYLQEKYRDELNE